MTTWINTKRKELGLSQGDVANTLGLSRPTYTQIEKGERELTAEQKVILASLFSVSGAKIETLSKVATLASAKSTVEVRKIPQENVEKLKQIILYILNKVGSKPNIGQTALYKLLYFIDFDYYEKYEEQIIGATYIKNKFGPTPVTFPKIIRELKQSGQIVEVKSKHFSYDQTKYLPTVEPDVSTLSGRELNHVDQEIERLSHLSASKLSELSHLDTPWLVAEDRKVLDYENVFYRSEETSVREYEQL